MDKTPCSFSSPYTVLPGVCDHSAQLGYADAFVLCQDIATQHATQLGLGPWQMAQRGLFWLTVKTRLRFAQRPRMLDQITVQTRPIAPERLRGLREYRIERDGELLICGQTEWAVLETGSGKLRPMAGLFPDTLLLQAQASDPRPFARVNTDFSGCRLLGSYTVRSTDIDLGRHMNNVAYLRALLGLFSTGQLDERPFREIELAYRRSCFEGDTLCFYGRELPDALEFGAFTEAQGPALLGVLHY